MFGIAMNFERSWIWLSLSLLTWVLWKLESSSVFFVVLHEIIFRFFLFFGGLGEIHFCFGRESFQFMYKRPWRQVLDFYSNVVTGHGSLLELLGNKVGLW